MEEKNIYKAEAASGPTLSRLQASVLLAATVDGRKECLQS
jgi:hypothetical protein